MVSEGSSNASVAGMAASGQRGYVWRLQLQQKLVASAALAER